MQHSKKIDGAIGAISSSWRILQKKRGWSYYENKWGTFMWAAAQTDKVAAESRLALEKSELVD